MEGALAPHLESAGVVHEDVGEHVWQVTDDGHDSVMRDGVDVAGRAPSSRMNCCSISYSLGKAAPVVHKKYVAFSNRSARA